MFLLFVVFSLTQFEELFCDGGKFVGQQRKHKARRRQRSGKPFQVPESRRKALKEGGGVGSSN